MLMRGICCRGISVFCYYKSSRKLLTLHLGNLFFARFVRKMPKAASAGRKKKANGYEFPDPLPAGEILKDVAKKEWCLGTSIGKGGFGEIYAACEAGAKTKAYPYAIKIEPHANGPLFVERSFYVKVCKPDMLETWKEKKNLKILGVPSLQGFGSHMYKNKNYRFVVMERFGKDLWSTFLDNNKILSPHSTFTYAKQVLDALEYIHSTGYVHADIKGANLLFGYSKGSENNLFLVDFGLACKFTTDKEFKSDPKKVHNGTIEYTSRDMHQGVVTRRGDLEILGFNILHWLNSSLPWENKLTNPEKVFESKRDLMSSVKTKLSTFAPKIPTVVIDFLDYISKLDHLEEPDYDKCRFMFQKALTKLPANKATPGKSRGRQTSKSPKKRTRSGKNKEESCDEEKVNGEKDESEVSNEENDADISPIKRSRTKSSKDEDEEKANWRNAPMCNPGNIVTSRNFKKTAKSVQGLSSKNIPNPSASKLSWRDCPTIKASNIQTAGQYSKKSAVKSKK